MRRIKNIEKLTKEDLALTLLKSESSASENTFMKHFDNNNANDNTYDDKARGKISDIRMILSELENAITSKEKKLEKSFMKKKKSKPFR